MPFPLLLVPAVATALYGAYKGVSGIIDASDAKGISDSARDKCDESSNLLNQSREKCNSCFEDYGRRKLNSFNTVIPDFIETFGKLKNVEFESNPDFESPDVSDFTSVVLNQLKSDHSLLQTSGLGLGAGLASGGAVAFGAYGGTMALASAGTGTAISTLSGVAATNATLAWLGGGTLATGGAGIAGGMMVLGGLVAGPALAVFGHMLGSKGEEALSNARSNKEQARNFEAEVNLLIEKLTVIMNVVSLANGVLSATITGLRRSTKSLKQIIESKGANYQSFSEVEKTTVLKSVKFAQLIKAIIDTPILDEEGNLVISTAKRLDELKLDADKFKTIN